MRTKIIYTIGHSTHDIEKFVSLLNQHEIDVICDVRSAPYSRMNPQYNKDGLKKYLKSTGIAYVFLGRELGARSDNPDCYVDDRVQYKALAKEPTFWKGLERLHQGIESHTVALMCAEKDPITCHRTILVCRALRDDPDVSIFHINENGDLETNNDAEHRLMDLLNIKPDMFQDEKLCIEKAYDRQAERIAYVKSTENRAVAS